MVRASSSRGDNSCSANSAMRSLEGAHCKAMPQLRLRNVQSELNAGYGTVTAVRAVFTPKLRRSPETSRAPRSEEHTSELQSLMRISYAAFFLKKKKNQDTAAHHT